MTVNLYDTWRAERFGSAYESLVVTYPIWVCNFPNRGQKDNPRVGLWKDLIEREWKDNLLPSEWTLTAISFFALRHRGTRIWRLIV